MVQYPKYNYGSYRIVRRHKDEIIFKGNATRKSSNEALSDVLYSSCILQKKILGKSSIKWDFSVVPFISKLPLLTSFVSFQRGVDM